MTRLSQLGMGVKYVGGGLALLLSMAAPARAQASGNGPYYANPSWDQTLAPNLRFVVLTNFDSAAVLDRETGLVWERTPNADVSWATASAGCLVITTGHRAGWRLPTVNELASLLDTSVTTTGSRFFDGQPFNVLLSARFWTATPHPQGGHRLVQVRVNAFGQLFYVLDSSDDDAQFAGYWCVRGGLMTGVQ